MPKIITTAAATEGNPVGSSAAHKAWLTRTGQDHGLVSKAVRVALFGEGDYLNRFTIPAHHYLAVRIVERLKGEHRETAAAKIKPMIGLKPKAGEKAMRAVEREYGLDPEDLAERQYPNREAIEQAAAVALKPKKTAPKKKAKSQTEGNAEEAPAPKKKKTKKRGG